MTKQAEIKQAQIIVEIYEFGTPAQKAKATRKMNQYLRSESGMSIQCWSWEERDPRLYASIFSEDQLVSIVKCTGYIDKPSKV